MQKAKDYLTSKGWKVDLEETVNDLKDIGILVKRAVGLSYYGSKKYGGEMTLRELEDSSWNASALWFNSEPEFQVYAMTHEWPLGRCVIGYGKNATRYDDTLVIPKGDYQNSLQFI